MKVAIVHLGPPEIFKTEGLTHYIFISKLLEWLLNYIVAKALKNRDNQISSAVNHDVAFSYHT